MTHENRRESVSDGAPAGASRAALRVRDSVLLSVSLGLAFGLLELPLLVARRFGLGIPVYTSPQIVWGAPLGYVLLFVPIGVGLGLVGRRWALAGRLGPLVILLTFLGTFGVLQVFRIELHPAAVLVLAAGLAWRSGTLARAAPARVMRLARHTPLPLLSVVAALTAVVNATPVLEERRAIARLGPAPTGAPNVVLLILDTVRAASLSIYGPQPTSPNLERLASDAVVFERAVATSSWSNPSHAGILTGYYPSEVSTGWASGLDDTHLTLPEALRDAGFLTGAFSANTRYVTRQTGMDRGFVRFEGFQVFSLDGALATTWAGRMFTDRRRLIPRLLHMRDTPGRKHAPDVLGAMVDWIGEGRDRPFFAFANLMDAHAAYLPSEPFASRFGAVPMPSVAERVAGRLRGLMGLPSAPIPDGRELEGYRGAIAELDDHLGDFFMELDRRGLLENTVVIVTSDHGEEFLENGLYGHGVSLYWPSIWVPLMIRNPKGVGAGLRVREPVSLRSLPATVVDLVGVRDVSFPGRSLARAWNGEGLSGNAVLSELPHPQPAQIRSGDPPPPGPMRSAVMDSLHYIRYADGSEELFDVMNDPWERNDLLGQIDAATLERFRALVPGGPWRADSIVDPR